MSWFSQDSSSEHNVVRCCLEDLREENEVLRSKLLTLQIETTVGKTTSDDETDCIQDEETLIVSPTTLLSRARFLEEALHSSERELRTARRKRSVLLKELTQKEEAMRSQSAAALSLAVHGRATEQEVISLNARLVELLPTQLQLLQCRQSVQQLAAQCRSNELSLDRIGRERDQHEKRATELEQQVLAQHAVKLQLSESKVLVNTLQAEVVKLRQVASSHLATAAAHESSLRKAEEMNSTLREKHSQLEEQQSTLRQVVERLQVSVLATKQKASKEELQGFSQAQLWERVQILQLRTHELEAALRRKEMGQEEEEQEEGRNPRRGGRSGILSLIPICGI